eukprot:scaffold196724_cov18-Tisochrysis_lutea.AAC.1
MKAVKPKSQACLSSRLQALSIGPESPCASGKVALRLWPGLVGQVCRIYEVWGLDVHLTGPSLTSTRRRGPRWRCLCTLNDACIVKGMGWTLFWQIECAWFWHPCCNCASNGAASLWRVHGA